MRILVSHTSPTPDRLTGITSYSWRILEALMLHGQHDYILATNLLPEMVPETLRDAGLKVIQRHLPAYEIAVLARNQWELHRLQRETGAAVIFHTQPTAMFGGMDRNVVVVHDLYRVTNPELYSRLQRLQWHHGIAAGFRRASHLIAVSRATRDALVAAYPDLAGRITVVHEAAAIDARFAAAPRPPHQDFIMAVANITANKNIGVLFEALDILNRNGLSRPLVIVGRDEIGALSALRERFPALDVTLKQNLTNVELVDCYRRAAAFVNVSLVEGFCLPILEAQACGTPVICADIPVLREVAGDGALFADPKVADEVASALKTVLENAAVAKILSDRAYINCTRFSWVDAALKTEAVFDRLLADRAR